MERNYHRNLQREGIGCMWVFISIFKSNQKRLLMDKKRGSKRVPGNDKERTCSSETFKLESSSHSVEELIEEERIYESGEGNRKRRSKTCEDINVETEIFENSADESRRSFQSDESEEKFSELIRRLIAQKESEIRTCKDLLEAFHVLGSKEDSSLKIPHDPQVSLMDDSQRVKEENQNPGMLEKPESQSIAVTQKRKCRLFRTKSRSEENRSQVLKTIVILKPGTHSLDIGSSPGSHSSSNKSKNGRNGSQFFLSVLKRRLQSVVGKKLRDVPVDSVPVAVSSSNATCSEGVSVTEADKADVSKSREDSKKSMSGIYIAAKKHLSQMLANGDIDVNSPDKEVPRILGEILSLPEFSLSADCRRLSPGHDLVSSQSQAIEKPKIPECSSVDYPEPLESDTNINEDSSKHEETFVTSDVSVLIGVSDSVKEDENMDKEKETGIDTLSETCNSSVSEPKGIFDEMQHSQCSPPESPPNSSVRTTECKESATDVQGKLSPVSVLEPLFTDDDSSPTSTRFSSDEKRMQPLCIRFDEADSPKSDRANNIKTSMDEKELALTYVKAVVKSSSLCWEDLLTKHFHSEQLLEPEVTDDIVFCSTQLCDDKELLYDCINEVLIDYCENEFNPGPWISFVKPAVQLISDMENATKVAQEGVYWHLLPLPFPHTLDQIVRKDMARTANWMDLRFDIGCIGSDTCAMILDELVEEIIRNLKEVVQVEPMQEQNSNNL